MTRGGQLVCCCSAVCGVNLWPLWPPTCSSVHVSRRRPVTPETSRTAEASESEEGKTRPGSAVGGPHDATERSEVTVEHKLHLNFPTVYLTVINGSNFTFSCFVAAGSSFIWWTNKWWFYSVLFQSPLFLSLRHNAAFFLYNTRKIWECCEEMERMKLKIKLFFVFLSFNISSFCTD